MYGGADGRDRLHAFYASVVVRFFSEVQQPLLFVRVTVTTHQWAVEGGVETVQSATALLCTDISATNPS